MIIAKIINDIQDGTYDIATDPCTEGVVIYRIFIGKLSQVT